MATRFEAFTSAMVLGDVGRLLVVTVARQRLIDRFPLLTPRGHWHCALRDCHSRIGGSNGDIATGLLVVIAFVTMPHR